MPVTGEGSLSFSTVMDNSGLAAGSQDAVGIISRMGSQISKLNPFAGLALLAVAAFAIISKSSHTMIKEFEHAMKEVQTISQATQEDFGKISSQVFAISKVSPDGPKALAEAYYQIVSAGYDGAKGLNLLTVASKAAVAGVTDTQTAADGITTVLNAFKLEAEESEEVADIFFNTVKLGKTNFEQLSRSMSNVAPLAAANNISFTEISAAIASLTKQGVPTSQAITQIRASIISINKVLGDGWADVMTYQEGLQALYDRAGGSNTELQTLTGSVESMNAVLVIAGDNLKNSIKDLESYESAIGATQAATDTMLSSDVNQWELFGNKVRASTEGIGKGWVKMTTAIGKTLNYLITETKDYTTAVAEEAAEFSILKGELDGANTSAERKLEILTILKDKYPAYLQTLDLDKIKEEDLQEVLEEVRESLEQINDLYDKRIELAGALNLVEAAGEKKTALKQNLKAQQIAFFNAVTEAQIFAEKNKIELDFSISDSPEQIFRSISKSILDFEGTSLSDVFFGDANAINKRLFEANEGIKTYTKSVGEASREHEKTLAFLTAQEIKLLDNDDHYQEVINKIEKVKNLSGLEEYDVFTHPEIKKSLEVRRDFMTQQSGLQEISLKMYKEDKEAFADYLNSGNEEIVKLTKERKDAFDKYLSGSGSLPKGKTEKDVYIEFLKQKRAAYVNYENAKLVKGKEYADKEYSALIDQGNTYLDFLQNLLSKVTGSKQKSEEIIREMIGAGFDTNTPEIEARINYIEQLYQKLESREFKFKDPTKNDFSLTGIVEDYQKQTDVITKIHEEKLALLKDQVKDHLSREYKEREKALDKQHRRELKQQKDHLDNLLENTPLDFFEKQFESMGGNTVDYFTMAGDQLGVFLEQIQDIYLTPDDEKALFTSGMSQAQIDEFKEILENIKSMKKGEVIDEYTDKDEDKTLNKVVGVFNVVGRTLDNEMGRYIQDVANLALSIGSTFEAFADSEANAVTKAGSLIGLIVQAGALLSDVLDATFDGHVKDEKELLKSYKDRLDMELAINEIYRERARLARESSAFLDSDYRLDFQAAIKQAVDSERVLGETLSELMTNGLVSGTGEATFLLGKAKMDLNMTIQDLVDGIDPTTRNVWQNLMDSLGRTLDPLDFFGGRAKIKANQLALDDLVKGFESALTAMGKTVADIASLTSEEWLDLFTILEETGHITDDVTRALVNNAKQMLEEYHEALEKMKDIISSVAGELGSNLGDALVSAFVDGTDAADNFADHVNNVLTNIFLNELINDQFRTYFDTLQDDMTKSFESGGDQSWVDDIKRFAGAIGPSMDGAVEAIAQFNEELESLGYAGFDTSEAEADRNSLSGAISSITEDTAQILAGILNSMRLDVRNGLEVAESSLKELKTIAENTEHNKHLEDMAKTLVEIETALT